MSKRKWFWLIGLILIAVLTACGANTPAATPAPLNQNFQTSTTDGDISFNYPIGWVSNVINGQIMIANSQAAMDASSPSSGQFHFQMLAGPINVFEGLDAQSTPIQVIQSLLPKLGGQGIQYSAPIAITIGSFDSARTQASASDGQASITAVNMGNGVYNIVSAVSASGELAQFTPTLDAILASIAYSAPTQKPGQFVPAATAEASG